jgi:UDP-N-acetylmuramate--alanine ligase
MNTVHPILKVMISGGGTGGHIFPAISIAQALLRHVPNARISFVGALGRMEMTRVPRAGFPITGLWISGWQRGELLGNITLPLKLIYSLWQSLRLLALNRPHAVVGVGGYASAPLLVVAQWLGIPSFIQEQNAHAGVSNRWLGRRVRRTWVAFEGMERFFRADGIRITGNPVRGDLLSSLPEPQEARRHFGLQGDGPVLLVVGGSLGARVLNECMRGALPLFHQAGVRVIWQTGKQFAGKAAEIVEGLPKGWVWTGDFIDSMPMAYAAAELVVSRAGAGTLSELAALGKPAILVPSPYVAEDHQTRNAERFVADGAALMVSEREACGPQSRLISLIFEVIKDAQRLTNMRLALRKHDRRHAADEIAQDLLNEIGWTYTIPVRDLDSFGQIYFLGIGGIGMSALARWFRARGHRVGGYDRQISHLGRNLQDEGVSITTDQEAEAIPEEFRASQSTLIVRTPAVPADHPQLQWFIQKGFKISKRAEVLGQISQSIPTLAVGGTHGKTTTSVLLAHLLQESGMHFTAILGGVSTNFNSNYWSTGHQWLVTEADEYDRSFLHLNPYAAVITGTDADHLDIYGNSSSILEAYGQFARQVKKTLLVHTSAQLESSEIPGAVRYGDKGMIWAHEVRAEGLGMRFDYHGPHILPNLFLPMGGRHNVDNALAAITLALEVGVQATCIAEALNSFKSVKRRFEYRYNKNKIILIDDYAHHPSEIDAFLAGVRLLHPDRSVAGIFQPHLFTRTRDFMDAFAGSLSVLNECRILPIYPAREEPIEGIDSALLVEKVNQCGGRACLSSPEAVVSEVLRDPGAHIWLCIGAGDIDQLADQLTGALGQLELGVVSDQNTRDISAKFVSTSTPNSNL